MNVAQMVGRLVARPWVSLVVILALTAGMVVYGSGIQIRSDMEDLFPEHTPAVQRAQKARTILKSTSELLLILGSKDPELNKKLIDELAEAFAKHTDLISRVEVKRDTSFFEKNALLYMPLEDVKKLHEEVGTAIGEATAKASDEGEDWDLDDDDDEAAGKDGDAKQDEEKKSRIPSEDELRERYGADKMREYFESPDGEVFGLKAYPVFKPSETGKTKTLNERLLADIDRIVGPHRDKAGVITTLEGDYAHVTAAVKQLKSESLMALFVALGGIALVLIVYFRRLRAVLLTLLPLMVGIAATFFLARLAIGYLNLITAFIFSILVGLGIDFVVHGAARADEEYRGDRSLEEALKEALSRLGKAMIAAAITTAAAFFALSVFDFRGFNQFGLLAGFGVLVSLAAIYVVYPVLEVCFHRVWTRKPRSGGEQASGASEESVAAGGRRWPVVTLAGVLLLTAVGAAFTPQTIFEADMRKLRAKQAKKAETDSTRLRRRYFTDVEKRSTSPALFITENLEQTQKLHRHLEGRLESEPILKDVRSIYSFVPDEQAEKLPLVKDMKRLIDNKYELLEGDDKADADRMQKYLKPEVFDAQGLPDWLKDRFTDKAGNLGRYVLMYVNGVKSDGKNVVKIVDAVGTVKLDDGSGTYHATASWMMLGEAYTVVREEGPLAVGLAAGVVLLFLIGYLRNLRKVLLVFLPLIAGFTIFLGLLAALEIPLNIFNIVVLPTIFGIGVDTAIHLVHRLDEGASVRLAMRTTGAAAAVSSLTTAVGFFALTFVSNQGLVSIGWVAVIGILVSYLTCVTSIAATVSLSRRPAT